MHKIQMIGRLGADPEFRYTPEGKGVTNFSLASTNKVNGNDETEWVHASCWGRLAEVANEYLHKGSQVYIEGNFKTSAFEGKDGQPRSSVQVFVQQLQMLDSKQQATATTTAKGEGDDLPF